MTGKMLLLILLISPKIAFGFDWEKCRQISEKFPSAFAGTAYSTGTTQYLSSWGDCSAVARSKQEQIDEFISNNFDFIKSDVAKGEGEYLATAMTFYDITFKDSIKIISILKSEYYTLFKNNSDPKKFIRRLSDLTGNRASISSPKTI